MLTGTRAFPAVLRVAEGHVAEALLNMLCVVGQVHTCTTMVKDMSSARGQRKTKSIALLTTSCRVSCGMNRCSV
jgi:hypothetical protein